MSKLPQWDVFTVEEVSEEERRAGKKAYWTKIGGGWDSEKGDTITIALQALPLNGRIVLRPPLPKEDQTPAASEREYRNSRGR